jgi:hypothetical protein
MSLCEILLFLAAVPRVPVVDFGVLPPAKTVPGYNFTITIELAGLPPESLPLGVGPTATPLQVADTLVSCLEDHPWVMERNGLRVTLHSLGKARVTNVVIAGNGPKPIVRWTLAPPKK